MTMQDLEAVRIKLIGPLPPPSGGMANQTVQLSRLLNEEGADVEVVCVNAPYWPNWISRVRGVRAFFRLIPYVSRLMKVAKRAELFHVMANSGWAWHLFAAPAIWVARSRGIATVVNYRGGDAAAFLDKYLFWVKPTLNMVDAIVVPSTFLEGVFCAKGIPVAVVPNVIDLERFSPKAEPGCALSKTDEVNLLISRNLESVYNIETALHAFQILGGELPQAKLHIAGTGPEEVRLRQLSEDLEVGDRVMFLGRVSNEKMPELYHSCDIVINPSLVDNMPISILEALSSGVPVVSTNAGGVPALVEHQKTALLVPLRDPKAMADAVLELCRDYSQYARLRTGGLQLAKRFGWEAVREQWTDVYSRVLNRSSIPQKRISDA